ncbi:MAG TPA: YezD family protein [Kiritimatiellia bacterium]|nr:YezD family protein [Kiritimatiellia bacterium]
MNEALASKEVNDRERADSDKRILAAVREVKFGSVEVTIHNGRVVQVERREKIRLSQVNAGKRHVE